MFRISIYGIVFLMIGSILYILNSIGIYSLLGLSSIKDILGEIGYYIFIIGVIFLIIHFIFRFLELYKITKTNSDRNCSKCGMVIPTDECICPYCWKDFEEKYKK